MNFRNTLTEQDLLEWRAKRSGQPVANPTPEAAQLPQPPVFGEDLLNRSMPRHPTRQWLIREAALHAAAVGSSSRTAAAVIEEMLTLGMFAPCPVSNGDKPHLRALMAAINAFAIEESRGIDHMAFCADCISLSCNPQADRF
jgi:hypothetical protein